ncbi:uncharacterized protein LOC142979846 isoform X15 [Anticarsia gemmatalis]|uniref:uncharacterized protein LOC142979846 isoform X11 n=1 Tax=Anticarsia gemmatalis TaxID=129554 RepID=UPI003F776553
MKAFLVFALAVLAIASADRVKVVDKNYLGVHVVNNPNHHGVHVVDNNPGSHGVHVVDNNSGVDPVHVVDNNSGVDPVHVVDNNSGVDPVHVVDNNNYGVHVVDNNPNQGGFVINNPDPFFNRPRPDGKQILLFITQIIMTDNSLNVGLLVH